MGNPSKQDVSLLIGYRAVNKEAHKSQGFTVSFPRSTQRLVSATLRVRPGELRWAFFLAWKWLKKTPKIKWE